MTGEIWKSIVGYEGLYEVSNLGKVRRLARTAITTQGAKHLALKILAPFVSCKGYYVATFIKNGRTAKYSVHRLVAEAYIENPDCKPEVNHLDLDKQNNKFSNLEWATRQENAAHATQLGRNSAASNPTKQRKLNPETVAEIKTLLNQNMLSFADIALMFNVSRVTIAKIKQGTTWVLPGEMRINRARLPAGSPKLNKEVAEQIRFKLKQGATGSSLAREYGVSSATVSHIKRNRIWTEATK